MLGYKPQNDVSISTGAPFRWGNLAPTIVGALPSTDPMFIGSPLRITVHVGDSDDTRTPKASDVIFLTPVGTVAAESCIDDPVTGLVDPTALNFTYSFTCTSAPVALPAGGNQVIQVRYADRTGSSGSH